MRYFTFIFTLLCATTLQAQTVFHTKDIDNFFEAFDSVQTTTDKQKQIDYVKRIYLDKGDLGIQYAIKNSVDGGKTATANHWTDLMLNSKENLIRIRPYFEAV